MKDNEYALFDDWFTQSNYALQKDGKVRKGGVIQKSAQILTAWQATKPMNKDYFAIDCDDIDQYLARKGSELYNNGGEGDGGEEKWPSSRKISVFLDEFHRSYEFRMIESAFILYKTGQLYSEQVKIKSASSSVRLSLMSSDIPVLPLDTCVSIVEELLNDEVSKYREASLEKIKWDPSVTEGGFSFKKWTEEVFNIYGIEDTQLNRAMWKYFLHSVKRGAFGLITAEEQIFFLIFSRIQGIGKSKLLKHLCDPFPYAFNESVDLSLFQDKSALKAFLTGGYALADFQEMGMGGNKDYSGASQDMANTMKKSITLKIDKSRELFTTSDTAAVAHTVMASSTNLHVSDVVPDEQYRRYFVFNSKLTREESIKRDWSEVDSFFKNTINDAYRSLNENEYPKLKKEMKDALRDEQLSYRRRVDIITQWLNESKMEIHPEEDEDGKECKWMDQNSLFRKFKTFCDANNFPRYSSTKMRNLIFMSRDISPVEKEDGKLYYCIKYLDNGRK